MDNDYRDRVLLMAKTAGPVTEFLATPFRTMGEAAAHVALGPKATSGVPLSMLGKRVGYTGLKEVEEAQHLQNIAKGMPSQVVTTPTGRKAFMAEQYGAGGAVGLAKKHPFMTAGLIGGTALYAKAKMQQPAQQQAPQQEVDPNANSQQSWG